LKVSLKKGRGREAGGYPVRTNSVSVATMRITPIVIVAITRMSLNSIFSKRNKNANPNTKANVDDLHSATISPP
jgi:hypothetical protein